MYKFTLTYQDDSKRVYFKQCVHPTRTKMYKTCLQLLDEDKIKRFTYYQWI